MKQIILDADMEVLENEKLIEAVSMDSRSPSPTA